MKIAIVAPSPVPFTIGGIENMMWGLYDTINTTTTHQAELIKLPSKELDFWELIESYYQFYKLDLSHFDLVITAKYPAWMVQHDNCIFYVAHRLRGLYDTYGLMDLPSSVESGNPKIDRVLDHMKSNPFPASLDPFFDMLFELKRTAGKSEESFFAFPGPLIRDIVHYMDDFAFSRPERAKFCAISGTVSARKEYFPKNAEVEVIYLPASKKEYGTGDYKYVFMISRLDGPKRIDVLVKAMKYVKSDIELYIAGTGPEKKKLEALAKGDKRIHFLGFVSDEEAEAYYSNSLVIPYFPYEEDYGLITVEAMMHQKPVITTRDSGGPTEFVKNGETGFIVDLDERQIAEKIDFFAENPDEARRMGINGYDLVKDITWDNVIAKLLGDVSVTDKKSVVCKRKRITVTSTFPIYPPMGGGQARIFNLYRELAKNFDIEIISYTNFDQSPFCGNIAPHLKEIRIPRELKHQEKVWKMEEKAKIPLSDIAELTFGAETPGFCEALERSVKDSDMVVISHPYLYNAAQKYIGGKPFVYEAHNVESIMKQRMLPETSIKEELVKQVFEAEKACCSDSLFVTTCSEEDRQKLHEIYGTPLEKIFVVPNGVDTSATRYVSPEQRMENKRRLGLENEKITLFMGSWHGPNLDACEMIFKIAPLCPDTTFLIMGSQCAYFKDRSLPENVAMLGLVSEAVKNRTFGIVDFALNPMLSGSGTNLKMFDYMSAGIPIISTEFGTRGIDEKGIFTLADTVEETADAINSFRWNSAVKEQIDASRKYVRAVFDWSVIAGNIVKEFSK